jgi:site-specific recombinase XerD
MLKMRITDFAAHCKVTDFAPKSTQSLRASLQDFSTFIDEQQIDSIQQIGYGHLSGFVADFNAPSIHKKKARVWCLHQFFHFLTLTGHIKENIASAYLTQRLKKPFLTS